MAKQQQSVASGGATTAAATTAAAQQATGNATADATSAGSRNFQFTAAPYPPLRRFPASSTTQSSASAAVGLLVTPKSGEGGATAAGGVSFPGGPPSVPTLKSTSLSQDYSSLAAQARKLDINNTDDDDDDDDRGDSGGSDKNKKGLATVSDTASTVATDGGDVVEIGQIVLLVCGPGAGKLATVIDDVAVESGKSNSINSNGISNIDVKKKFIIDGPQEITGVMRQVVPRHHFSIVENLVVNIQRNVRQKTLVKSWIEFGIMDKWEEETATRRRKIAAVTAAATESVSDPSLSVTTTAPTSSCSLDVSSNGIVHASLLVGPGPWSTSAASSINNETSIVMMNRAESGYSMNAGTNIKLLSSSTSPQNHTPTGLSEGEMKNRVSLLHVWSWIERIERISASVQEEAEKKGYNDVSIFNWPATGLLDSGVWQLLGYASTEANKSINNNGRVPDGPSSSNAGGAGTGNDEVLFSETLNCSVYDSHERRAALAACGWAAKYDLNSVMMDCERVGEFERSAALALWHGNIDACVDTLQRSADAIASVDGSPDNNNYPSRYSETLEMTAMCIAGFGGKTETQIRVWKKSCESLLQREGFAAVLSQRSSASYLRGMCQFLLQIISSDGISVVLEDSSLSLCDRVALACRFLPQTEMMNYLLRCMDLAKNTGEIEGLVVAGLSKTGIQILQGFMDRYTDVQTTGLVVSRVVIPSQWLMERKLCVEWVESYRGLLNKWRMWETRASFDVERAELLRTMKARVSTDGNQFSQQRRIQNQRNRPNPRSPDPDVVSNVPASIEVRCNYCSSKLSLKQNRDVTNAWLSQMQQQLNCCPQCRKPLPRCSVCLLSMSTLNPYTELIRRSNSSAMSSLSSQPFAEWFSWCTRCRHGGHAHHLLSWFQVHKVCPVSGCDCACVQNTYL